MDEYARRVRAMQPLPGLTGAYLPGGVEWERMRESSEHGISIGAEHAAVLEELAQRYGLAPPLAAQQ
jgi:LDH2 family malate/lactate/ureidoglycolate dehydrogenase